MAEGVAFPPDPLGSKLQHQSQWSLNMGLPISKLTFPNLTPLYSPAPFARQGLLQQNPLVTFLLYSKIIFAGNPPTK